MKIYYVAMLRRKKGNICGHWECRKRIPEDGFLCDRHYEGWVNGLIDRCPKCGRFKEVAYRLCLDCYFGRPVSQWEPSVPVPTQKQHYRVELSEAWVDGYMSPDRFFVYILEFEEGDFYVGHTKDIRKQFAKYKDDKTVSVKPKLQYLQDIDTEEAAKLREDELKRLIESNPGQVRLMISEFHRHMREFGFE